MSEDEKTIIDFLKKCKENKDKLIPLLQQSNETLLNYIDKLNNQLQQKENIKKEVREFVEKWKCVDGDGTVSFDINTNPDDLLKILDKGE